MHRNRTRFKIVVCLALAVAALIMIALPVFALGGDYGVNTGGTSRGGPTPVPEQTDTPIPPTATPSGPSAESGGDECC